MIVDESSAAGTIRRACYIDAALLNNVGHHANACRHITGELRRREIEVDILANAAIESGLIEELGAHPIFRHNPYTRIAQWKSMNFRLAQASFLADISEAAEGRQYDLVYINSVLPAQMAAMIQWGQTRYTATNMPPVVMEFGMPSGVGSADGPAGNWSQFTDQYRSAAAGLSGDYFKKFLFFTYDPAVSSDYSRIVGFEVDTLPTVFAGGENRLRTGDKQGRPVVGFLGHQRPDKGYHLIPDLLRLLLGKDVCARFLVHNGDTHETAIARELRDLATADARVRFDQHSVDKTYWNRLLDSTDIVVLPYERGRYAASHSGIAMEAVSCGLPIVSPNGTTMKSLAERYQNNSMGITDWTIEAIADAIVEAIQNFPRLARSAYEGADKWALENGATAFVSRLLAFAENCGSTQPLPPTPPFEPIMRCLTSVARVKLKLRESHKRRRARRHRARAG